jgi:Tfp pilus assembly protein PilE
MDDFMDDNGFIFTLDAALGLVIIFIVLAALANVNIPSYSSSQIRLSHNAQDTLETMATYKTDPDGFIVLQNVAFALAANKNDQTGVNEAGQIAGAYLNQTLGSAKYNLTETNQINATIAANADMKKADNTAVCVKNCDGYTFRLYIWD